jgi:hypothetical protein
VAPIGLVETLRSLGIFYSLARAHARDASKNPFNLNLLRGGDQRRQGIWRREIPISGHFCGVR